MVYIQEEPLSFYQKRQLDFEKQCRLLNIDLQSAEAIELRAAADSNNNDNVTSINWQGNKVDAFINWVTIIHYNIPHLDQHIN